MGGGRNLTDGLWDVTLPGSTLQNTSSPHHTTNQCACSKKQNKNRFGDILSCKHM